MRRWRWALLVLILAVGATLASTLIPATVRAVYPESCERGCDLVAAGWPWPYLVDHPGISPTGSVSLVDGMLGVDIVWPGALAVSFAFWLCLSSLIVFLLQAAISRLGRLVSAAER